MTAIDRVYRDYCTQRFVPPSAADISALEGRINVTLPQDFREYLLQYNGGCFTEPAFPSPIKAAPQERLTLLYGIRASHPAAELGQRGDASLGGHSDRPQVVPIGATTSGSFLVVVTGGGSSDYGNVLLRTSDRWHYLTHTVWAFFEMIGAAQEGELEFESGTSRRQ